MKAMIEVPKVPNDSENIKFQQKKEVGIHYCIRLNQYTQRETQSLDQLCLCSMISLDKYFLKIGNWKIRSYLTF